jgi:KRAB domain-containing zinc finger protein
MFFFSFQVNVEDINQLLAYHEVFGKLQNEMAVAAGTATPGAVLQSPGGVKSSCSEVGAAGGSNAATASTATSPPTATVITAPGTHICDICSKIFPFRYQLIVHRRYHTERKPFTCQVLHIFIVNSIFNFILFPVLFVTFPLFNTCIHIS